MWLVFAVTIPFLVAFALGVWFVVFSFRRESEDLGRGIDGIIQQLERIEKRINEINMG